MEAQGAWMTRLRLYFSGFGFLGEKNQSGSRYHDTGDREERKQDQIGAKDDDACLSTR